jgi:hypothetical protein
LARRPLIFVGTAKSVYVAPYGALERTIIRRARRIFVRDAATADALRARAVPAEAPGNVIVDLLASDERYPWSAAVRVAILPGSRERAYADAAHIAAIVDAVAVALPESSLEAAISIAPSLDAARFASLPARFPHVATWSGPFGALLPGATLAIGQAGTANEAAAACGVPVVALELVDDRRRGWYRMRQERLLDDALAIVPGASAAAVPALVALLNDPARLERMREAGRRRMGPPGGARAIAQAIVEAAA